ncbi:hypothetical protein AKJ16_DCAP03850 [Drosera capensis]
MFQIILRKMTISSKAFREKNLELPRSIDVVVLGKRARAASQCPSLQPHSINNSTEAKGTGDTDGIDVLPTQTGFGHNGTLEMKGETETNQGKQKTN